MVLAACGGVQSRSAPTATAPPPATTTSAPSPSAPDPQEQEGEVPHDQVLGEDLSLQLHKFGDEVEFPSGMRLKVERVKLAHPAAGVKVATSTSDPDKIFTSKDWHLLYRYSWINLSGQPVRSPISNGVVTAAEGEQRGFTSIADDNYTPITGVLLPGRTKTGVGSYYFKQRLSGQEFTLEFSDPVSFKQAVYVFTIE